LDMERETSGAVGTVLENGGWRWCEVRCDMVWYHMVCYVKDGWFRVQAFRAFAFI